MDLQSRLAELSSARGLVLSSFGTFGPGGGASPGSAVCTFRGQSAPTGVAAATSLWVR